MSIFLHTAFGLQPHQSQAAAHLCNPLQEWEFAKIEKILAGD